MSHFQARRNFPTVAGVRRGSASSCRIVLSLTGRLGRDCPHRRFGVAYGRRRHRLDRVHRASPSSGVGHQRRPFITKRPRTSVWIGKPFTRRPFQGEIFERDCIAASSIVWPWPRSTMAMSASAPGVSVPCADRAPDRCRVKGAHSYIVADRHAAGDSPRSASAAFASPRPGSRSRRSRCRCGSFLPAHAARDRWR